ncbi:MAG: DNA polymerase III subunit gamma/tau, partial [Steroidobacteraceae bacterium]
MRITSHFGADKIAMSAYTALYRTWRPRSFAEMVGQEHVLRALANALESGRVHHAFLFAGTRGVGKTTVARLLAKCLNCERGVSATPCGECASCRDIDAGRSVDLIEVDAASRTRVDDTRELLDNVQYAPSSSRYKIYLIDEVHMLSAHSFNALLKTLEEPPPHVKFLLATTDPQKLPVTVLSRCLQFNLKRLSVALISGRLRQILQAEAIAYEPGAVQLLAQAGDGSMRDALSLLDQLLAYGNGSVLEADARAMLGTVEREHVVRIAELLARADGPALIEYAEELDQRSPDYGELLQQLAAVLERVALKQLVSDFEGDELHPAELLEPLARLMAPEDVQLFYQIAILGRRDLALAPDPRTGFRMSLIRMLAFRPASGPAPGGAGGISPNVAARPAAADAGQGAPAAHDWAAMIEQMQLQGATRQLAANCVWLGREGATVRLALDASVGSLHTSPKAAKLEQALSRYFGASVRLQIELIDGPSDTLARSLEQAAAARLAQARAAFDADPVVGALKERFGASVLS